MRTRTLAASGRALAFLVVMAPALARAADPAAEALYQEGRRALNANDLELACRKFAESQARESAPGTLLNLGDCEERRGHLVLARESFEKAVAGFQANDSRLAYAKERLERAEKRVARLTVHVRGSLPQDARLSVDGAAIAPDVMRRLDRGAHAVVLTVPGRADATTPVDLGEGESRDVEVVVGQDASRPDAPSSDKPVERSTRSSTVNALMWGSFGLAAAGIVVGSYGGIRTIDAKGTVDKECKPGCTKVGLSAQDDGRTWGTVSTVAFIVGGAALLAGIGLLVFGKTSPKSSHGLVVPRLEPSIAF